jgi:DNA-binding XRE family transcriptional regulator
MNLCKQIKKYREQAQLSQDDLAEKIYVSRQTISNWENERSCPDIHNILLLSTLFNVSLDELVKGDIETMKKAVQKNNMKKFTMAMSIGMFALFVVIGPLTKFFGLYGILIFALLSIIPLLFAFKVEKIKKVNNIKTYTEILAFMEDRDLDPEERTISRSKHGRQKVAMVLISGLLGAIMTLISVFISNLLL